MARVGHGSGLVARVVKESRPFPLIGPRILASRLLIRCQLHGSAGEIRMAR
jgi:hypothetical protein